jgi:tetratricopeptide (TPR) repeat protein
MLNEEVLRRAHQMLAQGQVEETEILLAQINKEVSTPDTEIVYLQVWCTMERNQWEEVVQRVCEPPFVQDASATQVWLVAGSVRRRRPGALLLLGAMANDLGYPQEAIAHYQYCLRLLDERRMNIPEVRLQAHVALGALALATGDSAEAVIQYEAALRLSPQDSSQAFFATLYEGICQAYFQQKLFSQALEYGQQCLLLLEDARKEELTLLLSQICSALRDFAQAHAYVEQAWHLASETSDPARIAAVVLERAKIQYQEGDLKNAQSSCEQAWELQQNAQDPHLRGKIAFLRGKIAEAEWRQPDGFHSVEEAMTWYEQARTAFADLEVSTLQAEIAVRQARLWEARGQQAQALIYWKTAYQLAGKHVEALSLDDE